MSPLSDEYIRRLEPESLRYDVTIYDDFVISVLPNGIKTWAFIYAYDGRTRRKTLGVYPDMDFARAEDALDNARAMTARIKDESTQELPEEDEPDVVDPDQPTFERRREQRPAVLAGGLRHRGDTRKRKRRSFRVPPAWLKRIGIGIVAAGSLAAIAFLVVRLDLLEASPDAPPPAADAPPPTRAAPKPIVLGDAPATPAAKPGGTTPRRAAPKPIILDEPPAPPPEKPDNESSAVTSTPPAPATAAADVAAGAPRPSAAPSTQIVAASGDEPVAPRAQPVAPGKPPRMTDKPDPPAIDGQAQPSPAPAAAPDTLSALPATTVMTKIATQATATGGEVSRAIVTSRVVDLEPVDDLGQGITLDNGGYQTVFYFTELRNFSAGQIVHRWIHDGRIIADVPLRVGGGWRWRTYSSKDLLPGLTGDWRVAVIDGDGRVLGERAFRFDR